MYLLANKWMFTSKTGSLSVAELVAKMSQLKQDKPSPAYAFAMLWKLVYKKMD